MIRKEEKVPCEVDSCISSNSYVIEINKKWLCKEHMQELLDYLQRKFNEISVDDE